MKPRSTRSLLMLTALCVMGISTIIPLQIDAKVTGTCATCHTMHNSQNNAPLAHSGTGAGWTNGVLTGGTSQSAQSNLLVSDCVGCHSSTGSETIVDLDSNKIPIVYNINQYPTEKQLAGGNFHQVAQGSDYDGYGHNVYGISLEDTKLSVAPGNTRCSGSGQTGACHQTLAAPPSGNNFSRGGCQGCHFHVYHHEDNINYRFLNSHDADRGNFTRGNQAFVEGIEHSQWEQSGSTTAASHNYYKGAVDEGQTLKTSHSISSYCAGCHHDFHNTGNAGIGPASPWLRHPTDIALPTDGEYGDYDPVNAYNLQVPVSWINPENPQRDEAVVMCLSCHRVHGSEYPDILRWDYSNMIAGGGGASNEGCFVCHTTKD